MNTPKSLAALLVVLACSAACHESKPPENLYELRFQAVDDRGQELQGLAIQVGETSLGVTDRQGSLRVQVHAQEGQRYDLKAPCPSEYEAKDRPAEVFFRDTKALQGEALRHIDLRIVCARSTRVAALLIHAGGYEGMPVLIDGVARATTGAEGFAHLRLDLRPGAQFQVSLDSSSQPELIPVNPSQTMSIGEEDGLFVFDPSFGEKALPKVRKRHRSHKKRVEAPAPKRPVRID